MNESPFSWNTRYRTPDGWTAQLTIRADTGKELFEKVDAALTWLSGKGCVPAERPAEVVPAQASSDGNGQRAQANGNGAAPICPIHGVPMTAHSKGGQTWYSHKDGDSWCRGK